MLKTSILKATVVACVGSIAFAAHAIADTQRIDVPAGDLIAALETLSRQADVDIVYQDEKLKGLRTSGVSGNLSPREAVMKLLDGTRLQLRTDEETGALLITTSSSDKADTSAEETADGKAGSVEEIIVTASKRQERIEEVAGSVSAITKTQIARQGATSFADYLMRTPGIIFNARQPGFSSIAIRGVASTTGVEAGQATTAVFLDEVPLTDPFYSYGIPDLDTFDMERIEVLRGPQGTLFGSAAMGGSVNFVTTKPDFHDYELLGRVGLATTDGADTAYNANTALNIPLVTDQLAVRVAVNYRRNPSYISNAGPSVNDDQVVKGARATLAWRPAESTAVSLSAYHQDMSSSDNYRDRALPGLARATEFPQRLVFKTTLYSLRVEQELSTMKLTAIGSLHRKSNLVASDLSAVYGPMFGSPPDPLRSDQDALSKGRVFELRLNSTGTDRFNWLVGAMYNDVEGVSDQAYSVANAQAVVEARYGATLGAGIGALTTRGDDLNFLHAEDSGEETALFGEASYALSDRWKLTAGGRFFNVDSGLRSDFSGILNYLSSGSVASSTSGAGGSDGFTPKISLSFQPSEQIHLYGLMAKGYRFGDANFVASSTSFDVPKASRSDSLTNYEVGLRSRLFGGLLDLDVTAFYIDWHDIQVRLLTPAGVAYTDNAGAARNKGVEFSSRLRPVDGLELSTNATYLNARTSKDFMASGRTIPGGSMLPGASEWLVSNQVSYDWRGWALAPHVTLMHRYVSEAPVLFGSAFNAGGYHLFDVRSGIQIRSGLELEIYAENLANERGITGVIQAGPQIREYLIQPRTIGLRVNLSL